MREHWEGQFGDEYTVRNTPDVGERCRIFSEILPKSLKGGVIEFGCNKGVNMYALRAMYPLTPIYGVEVNKKVLEAGVKTFHVVDQLEKLPKTTLVFTCGVLIHIPPSEIESTMKKIVNSSNEYVLAIEYFSPEETEVVYRGNKDMLWKRDYGKLYKDLGLTLISSGEIPEIDNSNYWLFKK